MTSIQTSHCDHHVWFGKEFIFSRNTTGLCGQLSAVYYEISKYKMYCD